MPREPFDAVENRPKEVPCQGALGLLKHEVPSMPDEAPAGLEQPLLETREGPALDGDGQDEPAQQIAEVVGDMCRRLRGGGWSMAWLPPSGQTHPGLISCPP